MMHLLLEEWYDRWPNFKPKEIHSPEGLVLFSRGIMVMQYIHMDRLQQFRTYLGKKFLINHGSHQLRGWRSLKENESIGGKKYHPLGFACDTSVVGMKPKDVFKEAIDFGFTGVGLYDTFCHLDSRPGKLATWDYRKHKRRK
jgi:uncharacterized protein YcbK (DUF882 family)